MGIQAHGPDALLGQRGVGAPRHLAEGLENPIVLLQEKPGNDSEAKGGRGLFFFIFAPSGFIRIYVGKVYTCIILFMLPAKKIGLNST